MELDDAFANAAYIPNGETYPDKWAALAGAFRDVTLCELDLPYGEGRRHRFDLFHPARMARGVVIFVHGGYWLQFDKSYWSHLAAGPLAHGWAVAMPSYDLCPQATIPEIGDQIATAIGVISQRVLGPIRLVGHSAGGQLVARMTAPRHSVTWLDQLDLVMPVSPVTDLAPLIQTSMNADLRLDIDTAKVESPVLMAAPQTRVSIHVGSNERPVFIEQSHDLAAVWACGLGVEEGKNHFDVIEDLSNPDSRLTNVLCSH
ncbi:alpha/beta hydrolase family protein [Yoonia maritima]|uniref:Alpha/beta hydrolase family protein n=1 Tax=Yoonia maritima TaxID=1435347 RepID=A0A2T0VZZ8_9RHOB|nr:alpha/beta hydrolase [Yoonia maritima]PRY78101.1 alpha/beta hydrolase family protein [Yoonia maritima]